MEKVINPILYKLRLSAMSNRSNKRPNNRKNTAGNTTSSWKPVFAGKNTGKNTLGTNAGDDDDEDLFNENKYCIVCANKLVLAAKTPCQHTTCHVCSFRQRALYEKKACLVCRTENDDMIVTEQLESDYAQLKSKVVSHNDKYAISFTSSLAEQDTLALLEFRCPECSFIGKNYTSLGDHLKEHEKYLCTFCASHKKAFPYELRVYTSKQLQTHQLRGDQFDENFNGHPICKFCKGKRFYSQDELNMHYRKSHEECHVCKAIDSTNLQYFKNYDALEEHFRTDHYICTVQSCLDQKFVVFPDELDLKAHLISEHPTMYGNNFTYGAQQQSSNNRLHSQLSTFQPVKKKTQKEETPDSIQTKRLRLEERARHYLNYDNAKFTEFREFNHSFQNGFINAQELKAAYTDLFSSHSLEEINLLLFDLAEILNKKTPQYTELNALVTKQTHIINHRSDEMFPALSSAGSSSTSLNASWINGTVKTKKQQRKAASSLMDFPPLAAQPKRATPVSSNASTWAKASSNAQGPSTGTVRVPDKNAFPPLVAPKKTAKVLKKPITAAGGALPNYLESKAKSTTTTTTSTPKVDPSLFPALPASTKRAIPRVNPIPQGNGQWDSGLTGSRNSSSSTLSLDSLNIAENGSKKKGKKGKQILFQMGGR